MWFVLVLVFWETNFNATSGTEQSQPLVLLPPAYKELLFFLPQRFVPHQQQKQKRRHEDEDDHDGDDEQSRTLSVPVVTARRMLYHDHSHSRQQSHQGSYFPKQALQNDDAC